MTDAIRTITEQALAESVQNTSYWRGRVLELEAEVERLRDALRSIGAEATMYKDEPRPSNIDRIESIAIEALS